MYKPISIISIEPIGLKTVCDIEVQNDHTYVANGILNHNSDPNAQQFPRLATNPDIRKCLVASTGRLYLMMDYSQCIDGDSYISVSYTHLTLPTNSRV